MCVGVCVCVCRNIRGHSPRGSLPSKPPPIAAIYIYIYIYMYICVCLCVLMSCVLVCFSNAASVIVYFFDALSFPREFIHAPYREPFTPWLTRTSFDTSASTISE